LHFEIFMQAWIIYAILSAFFASLVAIFGKIGIKGINSNLAVAVRTVVIVFFAWAIVLAENVVPQLKTWSKHTWIFIILSAIATGLSWLFYYKALQLGQASKVAPIDKLSVALTILLALIFLGEKPTFGNIIGGLLVVAGVMVTVFVK
jgi:bacterial/archaeal transporter family protein